MSQTAVWTARGRGLLIGRDDEYLDSFDSKVEDDRDFRNGPSDRKSQIALERSDELFLSTSYCSVLLVCLWWVISLS